MGPPLGTFPRYPHYVVEGASASAHDVSHTLNYPTLPLPGMPSMFRNDIVPELISSAHVNSQHAYLDRWVQFPPTYYDYGQPLYHHTADFMARPYSPPYHSSSDVSSDSDAVSHSSSYLEMRHPLSDMGRTTIMPTFQSSDSSSPTLSHTPSPCSGGWHSEPEDVVQLAELELAYRRVMSDPFGSQFPQPSSDQNIRFELTPYTSNVCLRQEYTSRG